MKKIFFTVALFALGLSFTSCEKAEQMLDIVVPEMVIQSFANDSLMGVALFNVLSMRQEERAAREASQGFRSFGTIATELYLTIEPDEFETIEEIKAFVEKHGRFLQLIPEGNGEYTLEIVAHNNPFRYLANENMEIEVGGSIYLVTENTLLNVETNAIAAYFPTSNAELMPQGDLVDPMSVAPGGLPFIGVRFQDRVTSGRDRLLVDITVRMANFELAAFSIDARVQPYRRTLGIWFWTTENLHLDVRATGHISSWLPFSSHPLVVDERSNGIRSEMVRANLTPDGGRIPGLRAEHVRVEGYRVVARSTSLNLSREWRVGL